MRKRTTLVYGVGINDSTHNLITTEYVNGKRKTVWLCPFGQCWKKMLERCYSRKFISRNPTYDGCSVCEEWKLFSSFSAWMQSQDWQGKQLDKDILNPGNKIYSPENCIFVSAKLNSFFTDRSADRGDWPIGVCLNKRRGKFQGSCRNPFTGKREYSRYFDHAETAHQYWLSRKHELACQYAETQTDERIIMALRSRFAPKLDALQ